MFRKMYTTEMSGTGKTLKKRFKAITSRKKRGIITAVSAAAALVIVCGAVWVNASLADEAKIYGQNPAEVTAFEVQGVTGGADLQNENPYNSMYPNLTGRTVQEATDDAGLTLEEFLAEYELPADMSGDTYETAAYNMIPLKKIAEIYGMTYDELSTLLKFPDFVTGNTPWGEALDEVRLGDYIGTGDVLKQFKEYFDLDGSVNEDTKWKDVRSVYEEYTMKEKRG